ncbi:MAG: DUF349 domain-containing protein [Propionibacteriaceae bacterium]|nr:DUF349 domain-containing protein [Propionibacteriaceae bacterium]
MTDELLSDDLATDELLIGDLSGDELLPDDPATSELLTGEPAVDLATDELVPGEPTDNPATGEPTDDLATDGPATDELVTDEPADKQDTDKPVTDESVNQSSPINAETSDLTPSARSLRRQACIATKEALIAQAELIAAGASVSQASRDMSALLDQWKHAGRSGKATDDALWARFKDARDQMQARLSLIHEQRRAEISQATLDKEVLINQAESLASSADQPQAAASMAQLMVQWKTLGPGKDDRTLWLRFKAANDQVFAKRAEQRQVNHANQQAAAASKQAIINQVESLSGSADLRQAVDQLHQLQDEFRQAGFAGRAANEQLRLEMQAAVKNFYGWIHQEPERRRDQGLTDQYGQLRFLQRQIAQTKQALAQRQRELADIDQAGSKRAHGSSITISLGQADAYSTASAELMRLKVQLVNLEGRLLAAQRGIEPANVPKD